MGLTGLQIVGYCIFTAMVSTAQDSTCNITVTCDCCINNDSCLNRPDRDCETPCKDGYYGARCIIQCPAACVSCHKAFGQTQLCHECVNQRYGQNCSSICPSCLTCNKDTGVCTACADGHYGPNCIHTCSDNCLTEDCEVGSGRCYGCKSGQYGAKCNKECSRTCKDGSCDRDKGTCNECETGYHGDYCNMTCSSYCLNNICNMNNGICINCKPGHYGNNCNGRCSGNCKDDNCDRNSGKCQKCEAGYYGDYCNKTCSTHCLNKVCNMSTGICDACVADSYGTYCNKMCPITCNNSQCDRNQGTCTNGCIENFIGDICDECKTGKYGQQCDKDCPSNCKNSECDRTDGTCTHGCNTGFSDLNFCCVNNLNCAICASRLECSHCRNGTFGHDCDQTCPVNCEGPCDKETGDCTKCTLNHYGNTCKSNCSLTCLTKDINVSRCKAENGFCDFGCERGFYGNMCFNACSKHCNSSCYQQSGECHSCEYNRFGIFCEQLCYVGCESDGNEIVCSKHTGNCLHGCLKGFYGDICSNNCSSGCRDITCNSSTGQCLDGCNDGFTGLFCTAGIEHKAPDTDSGIPLIPIGIGSALLVIVIIVIVTVIFIQRKRRADPNKRKTQNPQIFNGPENGNAGRVGIYENAPAKDADDAEDEDAFVPEVNQVDEKTYYNTVNLNSKLRTVELYRYLSKTDEMYQKEFLLLPNGLIKPFSDAKLPKNTSRNRYNMVYPYNDSRVKVKHGNSDYINASYIDGYNKKHAYIACLGPTIKSLGDFSLFWKMIWQEKVETIVMVTKLKEASGMKCDQYWPKAGKTVKYGNVKVHSIGEEEYAEFVVRNMTLSMDNEERQFHHIHFTAWPDKCVPSDVISIVSLRNKVTRMRKKFDGPLVVHCSAGIGRTGTYIALDILIRQGLAERTVDVLGCVMNMRQQRVHMVQTVDQYKYLHHAVMWSLSIDTEPVPADQFYDLSWVYKDDGLAKMLRQLQMENWYDTDEEKTAVEANTKMSFVNRHNADIPGSRHAVSVMSCDRNKPMKAEYINAVFIDGYRRQNRFIAAQTPLPETTSDFLNMIIQRQVGCIIDLEPVDSSQEDVGEYLPDDNDELQNGNVVFKSSKSQHVDGYVKRELQVVEDKQDSRTITHYQFTAWPKSKLVPDSVQFTKLIHEVERLIIKTDQTGPILVHCMNGAERSALFCAMWLLIERIGADNSVSVLNTLRQVKSRRRKAISNKEQIDFCFQGVATHLNQLNLNVYSNT